MRLVKLDAINSTNNYLKEMVKNDAAKSWTVVTAEYQTSGRGQRQTIWESDKGKNLITSILVEFDTLNIANQFYLNCAVSNAVFNTLKEYEVPDLKVKWPNDIMSVGKKICGILIENTLRNEWINQSIIGIGLNVNQEMFSKNVPNAISMKNQLKEEINRDGLLIKLVDALKIQIELLKNGSFEELHQNYESNLFQKNTVATYQNTQKLSFQAKIIGVNQKGELQLENLDKTVKSYQFKEVTYL